MYVTGNAACSLEGAFVQPTKLPRVLKFHQIPLSRRCITSAVKRSDQLGTKPAGLEQILQRIQDQKASDKASEESQAVSERRRRILLGGVVAAFLPCGCPNPARAANWGYGEPEGIKSWGGVCASGRQQSPIDLPPPDIGATGKGVALQLYYSQTAKIDVIDSGHGNLQANVVPGSFCILNGRGLQLVQWHFHTPSEHAFDGRREVMEVHFVHKDTATATHRIVAGELAVIGVLLKRGSSNLRALQMLLDHQPPNPSPESVDLNSVVRSAFPGGMEGHCCHYLGSLTTPPCTEGVHWYVWGQLGEVTDSQLLDFQTWISSGKSLAMNSRPLQREDISPLQGASCVRGVGLL